MPTPAHERTLETVVLRCRDRYHAGWEARKTAWEQRGVAIAFAMQSAHLPASKDVRPA